MTKIIWKFEFPIDDYFKIKMPEGAEIIHINTQNDVPCIWTIVNPENKEIYHKFVIKGTGHSFTGVEKEYVGTIHLKGLVFHVFTRKEE